MDVAAGFSVDFSMDFSLEVSDLDAVGMGSGLVSDLSGLLLVVDGVEGGEERGGLPRFFICIIA